MLARVFAVSALLCASAFAAPQYASAVKPLYADATSTKAVGKLLPTAEVEVLKEEGNRVLVSISGYQDAGKPAIYFAAGKRILSAGFDGKAGIEFKKNGSVVVDGATYEKVTATVWTDKSNLTPELAPLFAKGKELFSQNCSMCHGLHAEKEFSANQWPSMFKSMAGRTGIDKNDYQLVIEYLQKHAKDMQ